MTPYSVALAAAAAAACLTSLPVAAKEPSLHQKKLAAMASDEEAYKRATEAARLESETLRARRARQDEFRKLCHIKPVMTDPEIDGCKKAYRL